MHIEGVRGEAPAASCRRRAAVGVAGALAVVLIAADPSARLALAAIAAAGLYTL